MPVELPGKPVPSQLGDHYVVRARGDQWRHFPHCRLPISIGQPYHEGAKFQATVAWVNRHAGRSFERCSIVVADTLQRHNSNSQSRSAARRQANAKGDAWLTRNSESIRALVVQTRIIKWDELLASVEYDVFRSCIDQLLDRDFGFAEQVDRAIQIVLDRQRCRGGTISDEPAWRRRSREYVLEEIAAIAVLEHQDPAVSCYPGDTRSLDLPRATAFANLLRTGALAPSAVTAYKETQLHIRRRDRAHKIADPGSHGDHVPTG